MVTIKGITVLVSINQGGDFIAQTQTTHIIGVDFTTPSIITVYYGIVISCFESQAHVIWSNGLSTSLLV